MARTPKFVIYRDAAGHHRWRLVAVNGLVLAQGEAHPSAQKAALAAHRVKKAALTAQVVDQEAPVKKPAVKKPAVKKPMAKRPVAKPMAKRVPAQPTAPAGKPAVKRAKA